MMVGGLIGKVAIGMCVYVCVHVRTYVCTCMYMTYVHDIYVHRMVGR